jgi:hypothetical protein
METPLMSLRSLQIFMSFIESFAVVELYIYSVEFLWTYHSPIGNSG